MTRQYFIGIDGGGTKTIGVLIDGSGAVLANARNGKSSIIGYPAPESCAVLVELKRRLCIEAGISPEEITAIGLGLNGIDFADEMEMQHAALSECLEIARLNLALANDGIAGLWAASPSAKSVVVQHGTAFTNAYRSAYGNEQIFDQLDVGGMFDIRQALTRLVARMIDGRAPTTALKEAALRHYGVTAAEYAEALFRKRIPLERIDCGTCVVFSAWQAGDPAAVRLVEQATDDYVCTALTLVARIGDTHCDVAFGGGVINHAPDTFIDLLAARVHAAYPEARVSRPRLSPAHGAAYMAAFHHGLDPLGLYERALDSR